MSRRRSALVGAMALIASAALAVIALRADAQWSLPPYFDESDLLATTPSTDDGAIGAMVNPAQWGVPERPELAFFWTDAEAGVHQVDGWGVAGGRKLGFSARRRGFTLDRSGGWTSRERVTDYQIGIGGGDGARYSGFSFGFSGRGKSLAGRKRYVALGQIARPTRWLSTGLVTRYALGNDDLDGLADIGVRPLSDPRLLLFGDYGLRRRDRWDRGVLGGGVAVRPVPGLEAAASWTEGNRFQLTLGLTLGRVGFRATPHYRDGERGTTNFVARVSPPARGVDLDGRLNRGRRFLEMSWKGRAAYQGYRYFDRGSLPLRRTTEELQFAIDDPTVGGVAVNLSGLEGNLSMLWELREKLLELKRSGKKVVIYCDRLSLADYYLASVADHLVMDPQGWLIAPGVQASRTYLKGTLEKIGIGFEEWRHFKYKSVGETFSRADLSEADREQLTEAVRAVYEELASSIAATGRMGRGAFDATVNETPILAARSLLELRWIDQVGRWEDAKENANRLAGRSVRFLTRSKLESLRYQPDETWGAPPVIALVYAVGDCAMDTGIRGRDTSRALRRLREDGGVKAVVLRVDSPGGDPLPSDLLAHETKAYAADRKPILVSQGRVAASGGYWISMEADSIAASPFTITGSIGVAGGWYWNQGLGAKLGLTSDRVQVGRSADLLGGLRLPLLGAQIPERNLDDRERSVATKVLVGVYDDFVRRVAEARALREEYVREVGEGRIYMGRAGVEKRLVDRIDTLDGTIRAARRAAGISPDRRVRVVEHPKPPLFRLPGFFGGALVRGRAGALPALAAGAEWSAPRSYEAAALQQILDHPGAPLVIAPSGLLPDELEATLTGTRSPGSP